MRKRASVLPLAVLAVSLSSTQAAPAAVSFRTPVAYAVGGGPRSIATADINQDGVMDVVTADYDAGVSVLLGAGGGVLQPALSFTAGPSPTAVAAADLDGDGALDLATVNSVDGSLTVLFGDGTGWFSAPVSHATGTNPQWVAAGDLDKDGKVDLVVVNRSDVAVLRGLGAGSFAATQYYGAPNQLSGGALADLDGDGTLDLALASGTDDGAVVLLGDGVGGFGLAATYPTGKDPKSLLAVDLNQDGVLDLVTANKGDSSVSILHGTGTGTFASAVDHAVEGASSGLAWGDFDGDCVADLAVTNGQPTGRLGVLAGDGSGSFWPVESFDVGASPKAMTSVDLDGDLKMDLVITQAAGAEAVVLLNDSAQPCTSFGVRRSGDAATVRSAPVYAMPLVSPFNDAPGTLVDGQLYFYVVENAAQTPLRLSLHADYTLDAVRLGFNDGDPASAGTDPTLSSVQTTPDTIPADGVSVAMVTVIPRDADGVELGTGLSLSVDEFQILPGVLAGPVEDLGDGSYRFPLASTVTGVGVASVSVEGTLLQDAPSVLFQQP